MTKPAAKCELSERDRRYLVQCALNYYDSCDRTELERLMHRLLAMVPSSEPIPQPVPKEEHPCSESP